MPTDPASHQIALLRAERLTLAVLICGVAALALSDFVSPFYWLLSVIAALLRLWRGPGLHLSEMQASIVGWLGFVWVIIELLLGRELVVAFTDFLLILAFAIVVEAATARNHLHRMLVGLFLLLAGAVLTDSVLYVLPMLAMIWFLWRAAAALYGLNWRGGDLAVVPMKKDASWFLFSIGVTALLFLLLPRFEFHSLLKATQPRTQTSGFSDLVQLGDFARSLDGRVTMRVEPLDRSPEGISRFRRWAEGRYWRGAVLSRFTGSAWQRVHARKQYSLNAGEDLVFGSGESLILALYREASDHRYIQLPQGILALKDLAQAVQIDQAAALQFRQPPPRRVRQIMEVGGRTDLLQMQQPLRWERSVKRVPEALSVWLQRFDSQGADSAARLAAVASELRSWRYDLDAPVDAGNPVASFLQLQRGHCELYATTLALSARVLGIPSRIINGYLGGDWNEVGNFLQIRHLHAHSWVEVWLDGRWQMIDATPPDRSGLLHYSFPTFEQIWESVKLSWYRYVLEFQNSDRLNLIRSLWLDWQHYLLWLLYLLLMAGGVLLLQKPLQHLRCRWIARNRDQQWRIMDRWLLKRGVERQPFQPLRTIAVPDDVKADLWHGFVRQWENQCYRADVSWSGRELKRHLRALLKSY